MHLIERIVNETAKGAPRQKKPTNTQTPHASLITLKSNPLILSDVAGVPAALVTLSNGLSTPLPLAPGSPVGHASPPADPGPGVSGRLAAGVAT